MLAGLYFIFCSQTTHFIAEEVLSLVNFVRKKVVYQRFVRPGWAYQLNGNSGPGRARDKILGPCTGLQQIECLQTVSSTATVKTRDPTEAS